MSAQEAGHWEVHSQFEPARRDQMKKRIPMKCATGQVVDVEERAQLHTEIVDSLKKGLIDTNDVEAPSSEDLTDEIPKQVYRRKVKKMVEVPVTRKVKVPTTTQQIVPDVIIHKVKVPKQIEVASFKWVDEEYTETVDEEAVRMKEIWTKKLVPETYIKKVEITKTRQIKVPTTEIRTIEEEQEIEIATTKVVDVVGFRVDEIKETKHVEIEGWQEVELVPRVVDTQVKIESTKEVEVDVEVREKMVRRVVGVEVYDESDARLELVETDSEEDRVEEEVDIEIKKTIHKSVHSSAHASSHSSSSGGGRYVKSSPRAHRFVTSVNSASSTYGLPITEFTSDTANRHTVSPRRSVNSGRPQTVETVHVHKEVRETYTQQNVPRPPPRTQPSVSSSYDNNAFKSLPPPPSSGTSTPLGGARMFGFRLVERQNGLLVTNVLPDGYAELAGIEQGDTIVAVDTRPVNTVKDWRNALRVKQNNSTLHVTIAKYNGEVARRQISLIDFDPQRYA